jgi:hypothetical protein
MGYSKYKILSSKTLNQCKNNTCHVQFLKKTFTLTPLDTLTVISPYHLHFCMENEDKKGVPLMTTHELLFKVLMKLN